jgi:hypothetical protein
MGHPLLRVEQIESQGKVALKVHQSWFLADGSPVADEEAKCWSIPLVLTTESKPQPWLVFVNGTSQVIELEGVAPNEWIKLNAKHVTPMRVQYSADMLSRLAAAVS